MNIHITPKSAAIAALITATAAAIALGPLNPPAGPVTETSPSLADLANILQEPGPTEGPWQVAVFDSRTSLTSQNVSTDIANGAPVLVHSINAYRCAAYVFNGDGVLSGAGTISSGIPVGQVFQTFNGSTAGGNVTPQSNQVILNVECPDGAEVAWTYDGSASYFIHVYYKLLD